MSTTDEQQLRDALERTLGNFRLMLSQKPVRDAAETIAEAEHALAQQAPTPAAASEPAAPVDARDEALRRLMMWGGMPPDGDFSGTIARGVCDWYEAGMSGELPPLPSWARDAALTRQAAAPAEGKS